MNTTNIPVHELDGRFSHHYINVKDVSLHFVQGGKGEPLFLLHGAFETWIEWRKIMPALAEKYTIIAVDLRGLGDSSKTDDGYDMKNVADDIYQMAKLLGFTKIRIAGHDLGASIAYTFAAAHPVFVQSFAFLEVLLPGFGFEEIWAPKPNGRFLWFASLASVPGVLETLLEGREELYLKKVFQSVAYNIDAISDSDMREYIRTYSSPGGLKALGEYFRAMWINIENNKISAKNKIMMPTLALGGQFGGNERIAHSLKQVAENVETGVIADAGHWIVEENPSGVTEALLKFFDQN